MNLLSSNNSLINSNEIEVQLNINYDLIKQELEIISDKTEIIENKKYYYKNNGSTIFAVEDIENNTINIFYKVDIHTIPTPLQNRIGTLTIAKNFLVFNREQTTGNLLCSSTEAAFLDLKMHKGGYKKV
jgi:hypothetical protein